MSRRQKRRRRFYLGPTRRRKRQITSYRPRSANAKASRALMLIRKFKKEEEQKLDYGNAETMQIPVNGNWIVEGFGPYMGQESSKQTRIGNRITVKSLSIKFLIKLTVLEALGVSVRLCIVMDRKPNGANATTNIMFSTDNQLNSHYNFDENYRGRFQFLYDKVFSFPTTKTKQAGKFFIKKDIDIRYNGNAGTVADVFKNNFLIMAMAETNAAAIDVDYGFIFRFTDA